MSLPREHTRRSGNGFPRSSSTRRLASKQDLLSRFQDHEDNNDDDDIFGEPYDDLFQKKLDEPYSLDNDFQTLKLSNSPKFNMHTPKFNSSINSNKISNDNLRVKAAKSRPTLSPHNMISRYTESPEQESFDDFLEITSDNAIQSLSMSLATQLQKGNSPREIHLSPSPTSMSTSSPKRRKSLSEYSEGTDDTDVTSHFDDEDFENLDDIFGNEESGIYGARSKQKAHDSAVIKAQNHLSMKQRRLRDAAELEELELYQKYNRTKQDMEEVNTLKLKDFNHYNKLEDDVLENDKTVNYEYTKDDFEVFEDGFDLHGPIDFNVNKLKQYSEGKNSFGISNKSNSRHPVVTSKMSMPNFRKSGSANFKNVKKFKSSINLEKALQNDFDEHPVFNNNNRLIRKLDRIPSFYQKNDNQPNIHLENNVESQKQASKSIEIQRQQLLNKFMEVKEKERRLKPGYFNPLNTKKKITETPKKGTHRKIGLVRNLNSLSIPVASESSKMKFNYKSGIWEGNDIELMKFEDFPNAAGPTNNLSQAKPGLITSQDFDMKNKKIHGNMIFDLEQLRWINLDHEDDLDIFGDLPNLEQNNHSSPNRMPSRQTAGMTVKKSPMKKTESMRGVSQFTQRTTSTNSTNSNSENSITDEEDSGQMEGYEFNIPDKLIEKFEKEEAKINKKIKNWFNSRQHYKIDNQNPVQYNHDYFWEIRKMVIEDDESAHEYIY